MSLITIKNILKMKRIIITLITVLALNMSAFAQGGTDGDITWSVENDVLTISGEGAIPDYGSIMLYSYFYVTTAPWGKYYWSIKTVVIEKGVTGIGKNAFSGFEDVNSVTIPNSVITIGGSAFNDCSKLPSISLPESVTSIGRSAFFNCKELTSITIPNSVISIEDLAFWNCESLRLITNFNPVPVAIKPNVFDRVNTSACTLEVPINSVDAYRNADVWKEFKIVGVEVGMEPIEEPAFKIYPNPTTGKVYIEAEGEIKVYDAQGVLLLETFGNQVDLSAYPQGVYLLQVNGGRWIKMVKR